MNDNGLIIKNEGEDEVSFLKRKAYFFRLIRPRLLYGKASIEKKMHHAIALEEQEDCYISSFWKKFLSEKAVCSLIDMRHYSLYKRGTTKPEGLALYIPDDFYYAFIDEFYTNPQWSNPCDDKNLYDLYFNDINIPHTIFRKVDDIYLDEHYHFISEEKAIAIAKEYDEVILKNSKFSSGGQRIMFWSSTKQDLYEIEHYLHNTQNVVCQETIQQHDILNYLNDSSVNTLRVLTFVFHGKVYILSSVLRMGISGSRIDNASSGGIVCGVNNNGQLKDIAFDVLANEYIRHPQGAFFANIQIPNYEKCTSMVKLLAQRFVSVSKLISWDITIDKDGQPNLIEFNLSFGEIDFHQLCNGPIFGLLTHDVLMDVVNNSYTLRSILKSIDNNDR